MGVKGLSKFIFDAINHISYSLPFGWEIDESTSTVPLRPFVIDGLSLIYYIYESSKALDFVSGGENLAFSSILSHFLLDLLYYLKKFDQEKSKDKNNITSNTQESKSSIALGKKIYVVVDGASKPSKNETHLQRLQFKIDQVNEIWSTKSLKSQTFIIPPFIINIAIGIFIEFERILATDFQVVWASGEADIEIAYVASKINGYILSSDSDFFVYRGGNIPGICPLRFMKWKKSIEEGKYGKMLFIVLKQEDIARRLGISELLLPLLATLTGNDELTFQDLKDFHEKIKNKYNQRKMSPMQQFSRYIKDHSPILKKDISNEELLKVVEIILSDAFPDQKLRKRALNVYYSYCVDILSARLDSKDSIKSIASRKCNCCRDDLYYSLRKYKTQVNSQYVENMDKSSIYSYLIPYRKRFYTWIFYHDDSLPEDSTTVTEMARNNKTASYNYLKIEKSNFTKFFEETKKLYQKTIPNMEEFYILLQIFNFPAKYVKEFMKNDLPISYLSILIACWVLQKRWGDIESWKLTAILSIFCSKRQTIKLATIKSILKVQMPMDADTIPPITSKQILELGDCYDFLAVLNFIRLVNSCLDFPLCQDIDYKSTLLSKIESLENFKSKSNRAYCFYDLFIQYSGRNMKTILTNYNNSSSLNELLSKLPNRNQKLISLSHEIFNNARIDNNIE